MHYRYILRLAIMAFVLCLCGGCILPIAKVYKPVPDPLESQVQRVVGAEGDSLRMADGRLIALAGIDISGLDEEQRAELQQYLRQDTGGGVQPSRNREISLSITGKGAGIPITLGRELDVQSGVAGFRHDLYVLWLAQ